MLTFEHQFPIHLLQEASPALRAFLRLFIPHLTVNDDTPVTKQATEFSELAPSSYRADSVFTIGDPTEHSLIVEVQRAIDLDKPYAWTRYMAAVFAEHRVRVDVIVLATNLSVANWAREAIEVTSSMRWTPIVIDPQMLAQTDDVVLLEHPQLAILCIELTRGICQLSDKVILHTAQWLANERELAEETSRLYRDLIVDALDGELLEHVRTIMNMSELDPNSEIFQRYFARGEKKGLEQGLERGERLGEIRASQESLRAIIDARGFALTKTQTATVENCTDVNQFKLWIREAATADSIEGLFSA